MKYVSPFAHDKIAQTRTACIPSHPFINILSTMIYHSAEKRPEYHSLFPKLKNIDGEVIKCDWPFVTKDSTLPIHHEENYLNLLKFGYAFLIY